MRDQTQDCRHFTSTNQYRCAAGVCYGSVCSAEIVPCVFMTGNTFLMSERRTVCDKCEFIPGARLATEQADYLKEFRADVAAMTKAAETWEPHLMAMEPDRMTRKTGQDCPKCRRPCLIVEFDTHGKTRWLSGRCNNSDCDFCF